MRRLRREEHQDTYERIADRVLTDLAHSDETWQHNHLTKLHTTFDSTCRSVRHVGSIAQTVVVEEVKRLGEMARWCAKGQGIDKEVFGDRTQWELDYTHMGGKEI